MKPSGMKKHVRNARKKNSSRIIGKSERSLSSRIELWCGFLRRNLQTNHQRLARRELRDSSWRKTISPNQPLPFQRRQRKSCPEKNPMNPQKRPCHKGKSLQSQIFNGKREKHFLTFRLRKPEGQWARITVGFQAGVGMAIPLIWPSATISFSTAASKSITIILCRTLANRVIKTKRSPGRTIPRNFT